MPACCQGYLALTVVPASMQRVMLICLCCCSCCSGHAQGGRAPCHILQLNPVLVLRAAAAVDVLCCAWLCLPLLKPNAAVRQVSSTNTLRLVCNFASCSILTYTAGVVWAGMSATRHSKLSSAHVIAAIQLPCLSIIPLQTCVSKSLSTSVSALAAGMASSQLAVLVLTAVNATA